MLPVNHNTTRSRDHRKATADAPRPGGKLVASTDRPPVPNPPRVMPSLRLL